MTCPIKELKSNRPAPKSCTECFAEKEKLCDFPFVGRNNIYQIITDVYFREIKSERL
jgi:hypothetical protein